MTQDFPGELVTKFCRIAVVAVCAQISSFYTNKIMLPQRTGFPTVIPGQSRNDC